MRLFECFECKRQAVPIWELFIYPSRFWLTRKCRHCESPLKFDFNTVFLIAAFMILGIVILNVIEKLFSMDMGLFGIIIFLLFTLIPVFKGRRLFLPSLPDEETIGDKKDSEN
jgi:prepilin signal peptidase PulO-like enzyme (type II secretory pathway)